MEDRHAGLVAEVINALKPILTQARRQGLLQAAFSGESGEKVLNQIDFTGANDTFAPALVRQLILFGEVEPGRPALAVLLESLAAGFGVDQRDRFNDLSERLSDYLPRDPERLRELVDELPIRMVEEPPFEDGRSSVRGDLATLFQLIIEEKTAEFVGREYVMREVEAALAAEEKGVITLTGDPGEGKSAILAWFVKRTGCVAYFNSRSHGVVRSDQFMMSLCGQLITRYKLPYTAIPPEARRGGQFLDRLLREASRKVGDGERLVVAIDALDEVDLSGHPQGANILFLPSSLPGKTYLVVTRRRVAVPWVVNEPEHVIELGNSKYRAQTLDDVRHYIRHAAEGPRLKAWIAARGIDPQHFVDVLAAKSENNFMYLKYVLPELARGKYGDLKIDSLPSGLESYYEYHWKHMGMTAKPVPRTKIKIVYVLSEVHQPVSRDLITGFVSEDAITVQEVLDEWEQFLHREWVDGQPRYSVYHSSFRDFLHRKDIVQAAGVTLEEINGLIADNLWESFFGARPG
ncbi:ATP-binding protein [bacterium]|nr:ATP-binding protein [bacterium]